MTREEAIEVIEEIIIDVRRTTAEEETALRMAIDALNEVQKHEETFGWCHDCKEYDTENCCCHRWSKVIRNTVEELKEEPPTIPCFTESAEAYKEWIGEEMGRPHGRLIDAGYLERKYMEADYLDNDTAYDVIAEIDNAPTVSADRPKVAYICDKRRCDEDGCSNCGRTTDIEHAKNFELINNTYYERR